MYPQIFVLGLTFSMTLLMMVPSIGMANGASNFTTCRPQRRTLNMTDK